MIEPILVENKIFTLLGCVFYGNPFHKAQEWSYENEIGKLWERFGKLAYKYSSLFKKISVDHNIAYELHLEPEEFTKTKQYYIMVGMEIVNLSEVPLEMFIKTLPKSDYVVFTTTIENKIEIGSFIYKEWLPSNNYEQTFPFILQLYDGKRYHGLEDPKSEIDWYIPVKTK